MLMVRYVDNIRCIALNERACLTQIMREVKKNFPKLWRFHFFFLGKNAAKVSAPQHSGNHLGKCFFFSSGGGGVFNFDRFGGLAAVVWNWKTPKV